MQLKSWPYISALHAVVPENCLFLYDELIKYLNRCLQQLWRPLAAISDTSRWYTATTTNVTISWCRNAWPNRTWTTPVVRTRSSSGSLSETNADIVQQRPLLSDIGAAPVFWYFHLPVNKNQLNTHRSRGLECVMTSPQSLGCFTEDEHSEVTSLLLFIWQTAWDSLSFQCTVYCLDTIVNQHILFDNQYFFFYIVQLTNIADLFDKITLFCLTPKLVCYIKTHTSYIHD